MPETLKVGDKAPAFQGETDAHGLLSLADMRGKPVILFFYPKDMTPGCTQEACDFRDFSPQFKKLGAEVIGISADPVERHAAFRKKYSLPFALVADPDKTTIQAYGVWQKKSLYGREFMGIIRSTFVIDASGRIAAIFPKVKVKGHVEEILAVLKALGSSHKR